MRHIRGDKVVFIAVVLVRSLLAQGDVTDLIRRAVELQQSGDFAAAAEAYRAVLKQQPGDVATHVNLGVLLVRLGQFDAAIGTYSALLAKTNDPRLKGDLSSRLGEAYRYKGDFQKAIDNMEVAMKFLPDNAAIATNLRAMGGQVVETEDGLQITGGIPLHGARLDSFGDHRIAMAFAVAGLFAEGETVITNTECVNTSYPGFYQALENILKEPSGPQTPVITSLPN